MTRFARSSIVMSERTGPPTGMSPSNASGQHCGEICPMLNCDGQAQRAADWNVAGLCRWVIMHRVCIGGAICSMLICNW